MGRIKIGEAVTGRNGKARFQYDIRNVHEDFAIEAVYDEYSELKSIDNVTYTILLETDMYVDTGDPIEISGYLLEDDLPMNQEQLNVFLDGVRVKTVLVNNQDGSYSARLDDVVDGTHSVYVAWNNNRVSSSVETVYVGAYSISADVDRSAILLGDSVTISGVLRKDGVAWGGQTVTIKDGTTSKGTCTTNSNGAYTKTITGLTLGAHSLKAVHTNVESEVKMVNVYDDVVVATVTGNSINLGRDNLISSWLPSIGDVVIDWGDGTSSTVNNPQNSLTHTYTDGMSSHDILFMGNVTGLGLYCFYVCTSLTSINIPNTVTSLGFGCFAGCTSLTSITIPNSVTSLGEGCFYECNGLTSINIPNTVTSLGGWCFGDCTSLIDYQLYWTGNNIITYNSDTMPNNTNTIFTIPSGETSNYTSKGYPTAKLVERDDKTITLLSLSSDKSTLYTDESVTFTGVLTDNEETPISNASVKLYNGSTLVDTLTTDSDGEFEKTVSGLSAGSYSFKAVYDGDDTYKESNSSVVSVTVQNHTYSLSISASPQSASYGTDIVVSGTLSKDSSGYGSQTVTLYDGSTSLGTVTTESDGSYSKTLTGLTVGSHSIKAVHTQVQSSTASVTITKLSTTTSLSAVESTITVGDAPAVTGTLLSNGSGVTGASVKIYEDGSLVDTVTTTTGGAFSYTGSATSTTGSLTFKAVYDGDATHEDSESSVVTVTVTAPLTPDTITISGTSIIQTGDSDTITATLLAGSTAVAGETLSYEIKHGTTTIDSGSDTTDSNGEISLTYTGTGVGDVDVIVSYGSLLQETYAIVDAKLYDPSSQANLSNYAVDSGLSMTFDTDHYIITKTTDNAWKSITRSIPSVNNFRFECDIYYTTTHNNTQNQFKIGNSSHSYTAHISPIDTRITSLADSSNLGYISQTFTRNKWYHFVFEVNGTTLSWELYDGTILVNSKSYSVTSHTGFTELTIFHGYYVNATSWIKNILIKPL